MSVNPLYRTSNDDATAHKQVNLSEGVVCAPNGSVLAMNGDIEEGAQLFIVHQEEDSGHQNERARKRSNHNSIEKKRKEKIRYFINKIGELLPPINNPEKEKIGRSTLDIVEKAYDYIQELKDERIHLLENCSDQGQGHIQAQEITKLREELQAVKQERDQLAEQIKQTSVSAICGSPSQWNQKSMVQDVGGGNSNASVAEAGEGDVSKPKSSKTKKRNTISVQLENLKKQQQTPVVGNLGDMSGMAGNFGVGMNNMIIGPGGQQVVGNNNVMMNQMMINGNQMLMPNNLGAMGSMPSQIQQQMPGVMPTVPGQQSQESINSASSDAGAGLLQLAMQDAGITPSTNNQGQSTEESSNVNSSPVDGSTASQTQSLTALQTLASVASVSQQSSTTGSTAPNTQTSTPLVSQSGSALTATTQAINTNMPIMATGQNGVSQIMPGNAMMNMSFMGNGQQNFGGNVMQSGQTIQQGGQQPGFNTTITAPQGQFMFINEHGVPCIANVPLGLDPNSLGMTNFQKPVVGVDKSGNVVQGFGNIMAPQGMQKDQVTDPNLLANLALQGQQTFPHNTVTMGTTGALMQQQMNNQLPLNQQMMQPMQTQFTGQGQQGLIVPASQNGGLLTVNSTSQNPQQSQNQLPQALILPNGQIIPVVANPQMQSAPVNGGNPMLQANPQWQSQGAPQQHGNTATRMNVPQGLQNNMLTSGVDVLPSSSAQVQVGQPQVAFTQPQVSMGLLMTTTTTMQGTSVISSSTGSTTQVSITTPSSQAEAVKKISEGEKGPVQNMVRFPGQEMEMGDMGAMQMGLNASSGQSQNMNNNMPLSVMTQGQGQLQGAMPGQGQMQLPNVGAANGPILLTMNVNGQPTSVLVDPTTMQVLGTVQTQPQQQQAQPTQPTNVQPPAPPPPPPQPQTTSPGSATSGTSKKSKKSNQRAICPKPSAKNSGNQDDDGDGSQQQPSSKKSKSKSKSKSAKASTVEGAAQQEESAEGATDILAKAAESIFSSDISPPISGFYNPANEDNPLQIDTSAGETEEDPEGGSSPRKEPKLSVQKDISVPDSGKEASNHFTHNEIGPVHGLENSVTLSNSSVTQNQLTNLDNVLEGALSVAEPGDIVSTVPMTTGVQSNVQATSQTKEKPSNTDMSGNFSVPPPQAETKKSNKRSRKSEKDKVTHPEKEVVSEADIANTVKEIINNVKASTPAAPPKKSSKKSKKQAVPEPIAPVCTPPPLDIEDESVLNLSDTITFSEKDLSDVLDQVESLGSSLSDTGGSQVASPPKKSKSKKTRGDANDNSEPASKKRKKSGKSDKGTAGTKQESASKSSMSVYDFDEEGADDFSSPLFKPLHSSRTSTNSSSSNTASSQSSTQTSKSSKSSSKNTQEKSSVNDSLLLGNSNEPLVYDRPLFDTNPPPPEPQPTPKKETKKKKSKHKKQNAEALNRNETNSKIIEEIGFEPKNSDKAKKAVTAEPVQTKDDSSDLKDINSSSQIETEVNREEKMKIGSATDKGPVHSTPKKKLLNSENFGMQSMQEKETPKSVVTDTVSDVGPLSSASSSHPSSSVHEPQLIMRSELSDNIDHSSPVTLSITEPVHISTNSEASDIDTMNSILGLSPNIISPEQQNSQPLSGLPRQQQRSPQLQTPKSTSPVSLKSPLHHQASQPLPQSGLLPTTNLPLSSGDNMVSCASSVTSSMTNFSSPGELPYSAESLFNTADKASTGIASNKQLSMPRTDSEKTDVDGIYDKNSMNSKSRASSIYSAENFVQSNKTDIRDGGRTEKSLPSSQTRVISPPLSSAINRLPNDNSSDGFNFANMGLNLSTPNTATNTIMDSLSMSPIISTVTNSAVTTSSFTFTLSSVTSTSTTSSANMTSHPPHNMPPFPFYSSQNQHNHPAASSSGGNMSQVPPNLLNNTNQAPTQQSQPAQDQQPMNIPNFDLDLGNNVGAHLGHQSSQKRQQNDRVPPPHMSGNPEQLFYSLQEANNRASCVVQSQREPQEQPPMIPNITVSSGMGKSSSDQIRNNHKRLQDMNQGSGRNLGGGPPQPPPPKSSSTVQESRNSSMDRSQQFSMNNVQPFFSPSHFSNASSQSTHPLHHPPLNSNDDRLGISGGRLYEPAFPPHSQGFNPGSQSFNGSRYDNNLMPPFSHRDSSGTHPLSHTPPSHNQDGRKSANPKSNKPPPVHQVNTNPSSQSRAMSGPPISSHSTGHTPPQSSSHRPTPPQAQQPPPHQPPSRQPKSSSSRSKQSQKKNKHQMYSDIESPYTHAMFDTNRSLTPFFGFQPQNLSPPARNMQNEGPGGLFQTNLFAPQQRHNASASVPKNADISAPFNPLFSTGRPQNGLGQGFLPGFGMNTVHGGMSNAASITPHSGSVTVTPHMSNFSLTNIFSDVNNSQGDSLNISPIKLPHTFPPQGVDPNSLQHPHHHQGGSLYHPHNRSHPQPPIIHNAMSINSILGHNHHGFDTRGMPQGMNTSVAPPFPGAGHPPSFAMPPLNFSMHDP